MKAYIVVAYEKGGLMEVTYPQTDGRVNLTQSTATITNQFSSDATQQPNAVYFENNEETALRVARGLAKRWPTYNWLVARTTALVDMPTRIDIEPEVRKFSDKGLLP